MRGASGPEVWEAYDRAVGEWPVDWGKQTNIFFDEDMVEVVKRIAVRHGPLPADRSADVRKVLAYFVAMTRAVWNDPDPLCTFRCGMTFYGIANGSSYEYIVLNIGRLQAFLIETMRRSGAPEFNITDAACRPGDAGGSSIALGGGISIVGRSQDRFGPTGRGSCNRNCSPSSGASRLRCSVITTRNSGVAGGSGMGRHRRAMTPGSWHPRYV
jgi:hypothetical protein